MALASGLASPVPQEQGRQSRAVQCRHLAQGMARTPKQPQTAKAGWVQAWRGS
jgi:hypothetical protein